MSIYDVMKKRVDRNNVESVLEVFCESQKRIFISVLNQGVQQDCVDYVYVNQTHYAIIPKTSFLFNQVKEEVYGMLFEIHEDFDFSMFDKKVMYHFYAHKVELNEQLLIALTSKTPKLKKLLHKQALVLELKVIEGTLYFSNQSCFKITGKDMTIDRCKDGSGHLVSDRARFVVFEYENRQVIFNVIEEDGVYYTLTKKDSNKMQHILSRESCLIYDGKDVFTTIIEVVEGKEEWVHEQLEKAKHTYFKNTDGVVALTFKR